MHLIMKIQSQRRQSPYKFLLLLSLCQTLFKKRPKEKFKKRSNQFLSLNSWPFNLKNSIKIRGKASKPQLILQTQPQLRQLSKKWRKEEPMPNLATLRVQLRKVLINPRKKSKTKTCNSQQTLYQDLIFSEVRHQMLRLIVQYLLQEQAEGSKEITVIRII